MKMEWLVVSSNLNRKYNWQKRGTGTAESGKFFMQIFQIFFK
jgi:hypothetical protein